MEFLHSFLENSSMPIVTAFVLGLLTAISPCPLATNITAIGFISKDITNRTRIFWGGILYTLGRMIVYTVIGFLAIPVLREGASMFSIQKNISKYGEMFIAPTLIVMGLFMLFGKYLKLPKIGFQMKYDNPLTSKKKWARALLLGIVFALAFCPSSGVFYFGMLIPMAATETIGYALPVVFAIATGLPVIIVSWILAYSVAGLGKFYNRMQVFQKWFSFFVALIFIVVGIYYATIYYS